MLTAAAGSVEPVSAVGPPRIMQLTKGAHSDISVVVPSSSSHVERTTTCTVEPWQGSRKMRSTDDETSKSVVNHDMAEVQRAKVADSIRSKFNDVFEASSFECNVLDESVLNDVTECNVTGRLNKPESVRFFESIGAPTNIVNTLRYGHHPKFHTFVPPLE